MFTGIVEELGTVVAIEDQGDAVRLTLRATTVLEDVRLGDSIAVNGCCLTVAATGATATDGPGGAVDLWTADVMQESLDRTSLSDLAVGDRVNLERATTAGSRLGGHVVQGHVDGVGEVVARTPSEHWELVEVAAPPAVAAHLVEKGSITVDGVSLTIVAVTPRGFTVSLIPETLARTTLGTRAVGERVNLEADILSKLVATHVERLLAARLPGGAA